MASIYNGNIKISIFGESHQDLIGVTIDGLCSGLKIDFDLIKKELSRRRPNGVISTKRVEKDEFEVISGFFNDHTTGTPLTILVKNENKNSKSYNKELLRPSHADYAAYLKYYGYQDYRGGGHFSGRITVLISIVGAIFKQILVKHNINIYSHTKSIYNCFDDEIKEYSSELLSKLTDDDLGFINQQRKAEAIEVIEKAKNELDSVGGVIELIALGVEGGIGEPFFDSVESVLAHLFFSVPAVKGVEFGKGFMFSSLRGKDANDELYITDKIYTKTNNNGGINGGITNGMPITCNVVIKPTPSIGLEQQTVNIIKKENTTIKIEGRHDPCIVQRARIVLEDMMAIGLIDLLLEKYGRDWLVK